LISYGISKSRVFFSSLLFICLIFNKKKRFDSDGFHVINSDKFLKRLTNEEYLNETPSIPTSEAQDQQAAILRAPHVKSSHNESDRKTPHLSKNFFLIRFVLLKTNLKILGVN